MKGKLLDWDSLGWQKFQQLSIHFAQFQLPDLRFEEYLKQGNDQAGIDNITTTLNKEGKYTVVQCKNEDLNPAKLTKIIEEFRIGHFWDKTSHFLIATASDMQTEIRQKAILEIKEELYKQGILFECWDSSVFEEQLKSYYTLVEYFFGQNVAKDHCFPKKKDPRRFIDLGESYIHRGVVKLDEVYAVSNYWRLSGVEPIDLKEYLVSERISFPKVCIIGDPYQGKSSLLKQTAFELTQIDNPFVPILIELKSYNIQPIEQLLMTQEGAWLSSPIADLIIFIDGLDEVPTDKFNEAIGYIKAFSDSYPYLCVVFSCRKIFYYHYEVVTKVNHFKPFELADLQRKDIDLYLRQQLGTRIEKFGEEVKKIRLEGLLEEPFYLTEMITAFKSPPYKLPGSKAAIIELFIKKSIQSSSLRKLSKGKDFAHRVQTYKIAVHKLAYALQVLGLNALPENIMQDLFEDNEQEVLQHSALVTITNQQWSFSSALFQEFLSARVLSKLDYSTVVQLCTVGEKIVKIRSKWIQTISTLLAILSPIDKRREEYIALVEHDNIELFFETDRTKYDSEFRLRIVEKLINRTIEKNIRTMTVYEDKIGAFIGSDDDAIDSLLNTIESKLATEVVKVLCYRTLLYVLPDRDRIDQIIRISKKEIKQTRYPYLAGHCVQLLTQYQSFDRETAMLLIGQIELNLSHEYREEVYSFLEAGNFVDQFYDYGLGGIKPLQLHNKEINHHDSERSLMAFLLKFNTRENLQLLLQCIQQEDWLLFLDCWTDDRKTFLSDLSSRCIDLFIREPLVVVDIVGYIKNLKGSNTFKEIEGLNHFFKQTNTSAIASGLLIDDILSEGGYNLCGLLTESSIGYLLHEHDSGNYDVNVLWNCFYGLERAKKTELAAKLSIIYRDLLSLEPPKEPSQHDAWMALEAKKSENDLLYFQSKEKFKEGLTVMFRSFGKKRLTTHELYIELKDKEVRINAASNLMYSLIHLVSGNSDSITLEKCLAFIDNKVKYEYFLVNDILKRDKPRNNTDVYITFLESYYNEEIAKANFENCHFPENGKWKFRIKEVLLKDIFEKFLFATPAYLLVKLVWMEKRGARDLHEKEFNSQKSLSELILENLTTDEMPLLREEVYNNMKIGIYDDLVFKSHAAFCKYFQIIEARDIILKRMIDAKTDEFQLTNLATVYLALEGKPSKLLPVLANVLAGNYAFIGLVDLVIKDCPKEVTFLLRECLSMEGQNKMKISAALRLASLGEVSGLAYLVDFIKTNAHSPINIQGSISVAKVDTNEALILFSDIAIYILDSDVRNFHDSARSILLEWLFGLANKSEEDLNLVIAFLSVQMEQFKDHPSVSNINWYIEKCIEMFRESSVYTVDLSFIKDTFESVSKGSLDF